MALGGSFSFLIHPDLDYYIGHVDLLDNEQHYI